jgi:hypothetical protein
VHLKENNVPHGNMKKVVKLLPCLPGSIESIERAFSRVNYIWSEKQSRFYVGITQTILVVKTNTDLSCKAFNDKLASYPGVLKEIHSSDI